MNVGVRMLMAALRPLGRRWHDRRAGDEQSVRFDPALATDGVLELTSEVFVDGGPLPEWTSASPRAENVSPPLAWSALPPGTLGLVLIIEDVDVPFAHPSIHCLAVLDVGLRGLPRDGLSRSAPAPGVRLLTGSHGRRGYSGPFPFPGHGPHRYHVHLVALDVSPEASVDDLPALLAAARGHVLARGLLTGTQVG